MDDHLTQVKTKLKVHKDLIKVLKDKDILFLENDWELDNSSGMLEEWLILNKIKYNVIFDVQHLSLNYIAEQIQRSQIIVFETTWTYEISRKLEEYISKLQDKKIVIECYINEPTWFYKPKGVKHDVYVLQSLHDNMEDWTFDKLRLHKPIWED